MPEYKTEEKIIVGDDVFFPRLAVGREHDEINFIAEQAVLDPPVKREDGGVIQVGVRRALTEIKRENRDPVLGHAAGLLAAGKTEKLEQLPARFLAVMNLREHGIQKIVLMRGHAGFAVAGKKRRDGPSRRVLRLLGIIKRPGGLRALAGFQRQLKPVKNRAAIRVFGGPRPRPAERRHRHMLDRHPPKPDPGQSAVLDSQRLSVARVADEQLLFQHRQPR